MKRKIKSLIVNIIILCSSISITLLCIEAVCRAILEMKIHYVGSILLAKESKYRGLPFELIPNGESCNGCNYYINKFGLRNPEIILPKPPNIYRITVLGDSQVYGGDSFEGTIPYQLQQNLNDSKELIELIGKRFEVINGGIFTLNLKGVYYLFHHIIRQIEPDMVIYVFFVNDLENSLYKPIYKNGYTSFVYYGTSNLGDTTFSIIPEKLDRFLNSNSYFYRYIGMVYEGIKYRGYKSKLEGVYSNQLIYFDRMLDEAKEDKIYFATTILGNPKDMSECEFDSFNGEIAGIYYERVKNKKVPYINILDTLCGQSIKTLDRGDGCHFTDYAHSIIAKRLYEGVREFLLKGDAVLK